jgi:hypothetical protein
MQQGITKTLALPIDVEHLSNPGKINASEGVYRFAMNFTIRLDLKSSCIN